MIASFRIPLRGSICDPAAVFKNKCKYDYHGVSNNRLKSTVSLRLFSSRSSIATTATTPPTTCWRWHCSPGRTPSRTYSTRTSTLNDTRGAGANYNGYPRTDSDSKNLRRKYIKYAVIGTVLGVGTIAFYDQIEHVYYALTRSGRVVGALAVCINDYRKTLKLRDQLPPEEYAETLRACHKRCAVRTLHVLEKNGSVFIKLGQHLSSMSYLLPLEWTTTFIPLQDNCPVSSIESIQNLLVTDTGHTMDELFETFEPTPIGAASLAQVHIATLKDSGNKVAVKVQHPVLAEWVPLDLALTRFTFSMLKRFFPEYDLEWLSREMDMSLPQELDFRNEARNAARTSEYFKKHSNAPLVIPDVIWAKERLVVMDYVTGHRPDDLEYLDFNGIDRDEVSAALAHIFNEMIFGEDAPLHCDPHGGNIAIRKNSNRRYPNFDIILYDHGLYRDIPRDMRRNYAKMWLAVIDADIPKMRKYAHEVAGITDEQFPLFASAITGRDYSVLVNKNVTSSRTAAEKEQITGALGDGMLQQLVDLLSKVPRIILLILKTNDLTRSLDENLHTRQGPVRTFLILARYATRCVFEENMESIHESGGVLFRPSNLWNFLKAWFTYMRVELKLSVYERVLSLKSRFGIRTAI